MPFLIFYRFWFLFFQILLLTQFIPPCCRQLTFYNTHLTIISLVKIAMLWGKVCYIDVFTFLWYRQEVLYWGEVFDVRKKQVSETFQSLIEFIYTQPTLSSTLQWAFLCPPLWCYRFTAKVNIVPISLVNKNKALPTRVLGEIILRSPTTDCYRPKRGVFLTEKIHWNNSRHPGVYCPLYAVADL